jgi:hypothetical protein
VSVTLKSSEEYLEAILHIEFLSLTTSPLEVTSAWVLECEGIICLFAIDQKKMDIRESINLVERLMKLIAEELLKFIFRTFFHDSYGTFEIRTLGSPLTER